MEQSSYISVYFSWKKQDLNRIVAELSSKGYDVRRTDSISSYVLETIGVNSDGIDFILTNKTAQAKGKQGSLTTKDLQLIQYVNSEYNHKTPLKHSTPMRIARTVGWLAGIPLALWLFRELTR